MDDPKNDTDAFNDSIGYIKDWIKNGDRSVTMLAQLMCVAAMRADGVHVSNILMENIQEYVKEVTH